jgi:diguanylate cyclase (GGDEF)-like protein/PAS domain S-box-containing protein
MKYKDFAWRGYKGEKTVLSKLKQWGFLDLFEKEEDRRMARILLSIILIGWLASLLALFVDLIWWGKKLAVPLILGGILQLIPLGLLLRKKLSASSFILVGIYILITTALATIGDGVHDYVMMIYPIIIMFAGLMTQQRSLWFSTLLTFAAFTWLVFGESNGWFVVEKSFVPDRTDLLIAGMLILITVWVVYILVSNMQYGLTQTWRELAKRQRAEESLRKSQQNLQALIENSDGSIWSVDAEYRLIIGNALYHRNVSAAIGRKLLEGENVLAFDLSQDALNEWQGYYDRALQGEKFSVETQTRFEPYPLDMEYHFNPIRGEDGKNNGVTIFGRDITERKRIENALSQSEQRFKSYVQNAPNIITVVDHENHIRYINRTEFNLPDSMFIGKNILDFVSSEFRETMQNALKQTRETTQPCSYITSAKLEDTTAWYENRATVVEPQNPLTDVIIISANITDRKQMEEELHKSREDFQRYFNMGTVGMAVTTPDKIWVEVNDRLCQIFGYSKEELTKLTWVELTYPGDLDTNLKLFDQMMSGEIDSYQLDKRYVRKDKSVIYTTISAACHRNSDGTVRHLLTSIIDITERKRNEALSQIRFNLLEFAAEHSLNEFMQKALDEIGLFTNSAIGFYHFIEPDQKTISLQAWSTRTLEEFCKAEGKGTHYAIDKAGIWADCIKQGKPIIHNDYAALPAAHRKGFPDGHAEVIRDLVVPVFRGGKVVSILGIGNKPSDYTEKDVAAVAYIADVVWEIVKRKQTEQSLNEMNSRLRLLGDNLEEAALYVYSHDNHGMPHFEYLSAGMEKLTGITKEQALQDASSLHATILPEYLPVLTELEAKSKEDLLSFKMEICQKHAISGEIRWALLRSTPRRRSDGSTVWYGVEMDITERKQNEKLLEEANEQLRLHVKEIEQLHEELREQAIRDSLTGLYNRRYMQDVFNQEFSRARRENYPVSVIMLDMDELKVFNDTYGHHVGDQALQALAFQLQNMTRKEDIVCRYGGDEFTVILSKTFPKDAVKRVEEWRDSLTKHPLEIEGKNSALIKFTAGIASFPAHGSSMEEIINYADVALYRAKAHGRNCTVVFKEFRE